METIIKKWGNSLGIRFPKVYTEETGIHDGSKVDIKVADGKLIIEPIKEEDQSLDELLQQVKPDNLHDEIESEPMGDELW